MPNWCSNKLKVTGPSIEIQEFVKANTSEELFSLNAFVTMPSELEDSDGWYDWRVRNWGTKWDLNKNDQIKLEETVIGDGSSSVECYFDTAWAPPVAWQATVSLAFPSLNFSLWYDESGGDFAGLSELVNGVDQPNSWDDSSYNFGNCSAPNCEEIVYGPFSWERDKNTTIGKLFCQIDHALEGEVFRVISQS